MKLKKYPALLLAVFLLMALCACGGAGDGTAASGAEESAAATPAPEEGAAIVPEQDETTPEPLEDAAGNNGAPANITETVLLDEKDVKITATGIDYDGWAGPELMLTIENNTAETLAFMCEDVYINGCKILNGLYTEVGAGETEDEAMSLYTGELAAYGIDTIAEITMYFCIDVVGDWETYLLPDPVTLRTDADGAFTYTPGGEVLCDARTFRIVGIGPADEDTYWGPAYLVYFENNTNRTLTLQARDGAVDGHAVDAIISMTLRPGMCAIDDLTVNEEELEALGIDELGTLEVRFAVYDDETREELAETDVIKVGF